MTRKAPAVDLLTGSEVLTPSPHHIPAQFTALPSPEIPPPRQWPSLCFTRCHLLRRHSSAVLVLSQGCCTGVSGKAIGLDCMKGSVLHFPDFFCRLCSFLIRSSQQTVIPIYLIQDFLPLLPPTTSSPTLSSDFHSRLGEAACLSGDPLLTESPAGIYFTAETHQISGRKFLPIS